MMDEAFIRGSIPMTKSEIRAISLSKLELEKNSLVLDIGCGTGSISIECGKQCSEGSVIAIDQNEEAIALTKLNMEQLHVKNIIPIHGKAPEDIPIQEYDRIFLGGGSKAIDRIISFSKDHLKPKGIFVANTILLESTIQILKALEEQSFEELSCTQVQIGRGQKVSGWMMKALNPVYIITAKKSIREEESNG